MNKAIKTKELVATVTPLDVIINQWLFDRDEKIREVIDIKYAVTDSNAHVVRRALIIYEEA